MDIGTVLGHYRIVARLGAGGMGEVYQAHDSLLDRPVALKILPASLLDNPDRVRRFMQEAKAASALNHPHIVTIYEIGQVDGGPPPEPADDGRDTAAGRRQVHYIAMEYIDGDTLRAKIHAEKVELKKLLEYLTQVADGLAKAHASGIVHRDLKPENIMVARDGYAKILDFGLAKLVEPLPSPGDDALEAETLLMGRTLPGVVMGTLGYMSPEQVQGKNIDQRSDIFSFGCILYEAATRRKPFDGVSVIDSMHKIVYAQAPPISEFNPDTPIELQRIIRKCLSKDPDERYQSIKDVTIDLRQMLREYDSLPSVSAASFASGARQALEAPPRPSRRVPKWLWAAAALVVVGLLAVGVVQWIGGRQPRGEPPFQTMRLTKLTNSGNVVSGVVSPDGKYVAQAVQEAGQQSLVVRQIATSSNVTIVPPAEIEYRGMTFSPDGNFIYYIAGKPEMRISTLYQIPVLGGTPRRLVEDVDSPVTFAPDGRRMAYVRGYPSEESYSIVIANADGTGEQRIVTRKGTSNFSFDGPSWSPDGRTIACGLLSTEGGAHMQLIGVDVADGAERPLSPSRWLRIGRVQWLKDGSGLVMVAAEEGSRLLQIWRVSLPGGEARRITNDLNSYVCVSLTADSKSLVAVQSDYVASLWVIPNGDMSRAMPVSSGAARGEGVTGISWMPDGRIVYGSISSGNYDLWTISADRSGRRELATDSPAAFHPAATPDGRYIVYVAASGNNRNIWRMNADGSNPKQLTFGIAEILPSVTPDSRWVVYTSANSLKPTLWKVSIDGGEPVQITSRMALRGVVSPDGRMIACMYWNEQLGAAEQIALFSMDGGEPVRTFDAQTYLLRWSPDGQSIVYVETRGGVSNLWSQPVNGGAPRQLTRFINDMIFNFDYASDGRSLACSRGVVTNDMVLINDFR